MEEGQGIRAWKKLREPVSGLTHCVGALLAVAGMVALIVKAADPPRPWHLTTFSVFGAGMILLYTVSTLYHWLMLSEAGTARLRRLDHIMIFVLISATYTPFCLIPFRGAFGWSLFGCIWSIALLGIVFKIFWIHAPRWVSVMLYVLMGWLAVVGAGPMVRILQPGAVFWLVTGGVLYTVGALVYAFRRPNPIPTWFGFHEVFHLFVMMGTGAHFWVLYRYLAEFS
ncbi:MAG: hemolysin III family protein [Desulfomonilia bacterium]|jgi:hemolysin III